MQEFKFSINPPKFESDDEFELSKKFPPLNVQYLQHIQADLMNELLESSKIHDATVRDQLIQRCIGGLNIIAALLTTSDTPIEG